MVYHDRHSIRLPNWDYSSGGFYFVTICTCKRESIFGEIKNDKMIVNDIGKITNDIWESLPKHHNVNLDAFQIMPNHFHGIIQIDSVGALRATPFNQSTTPVNQLATPVNQPGTPVQKWGTPVKNFGIMSNISPKPKSLSSIIRSFKSECTRQIRMDINGRNTLRPYIIWQRNFYEHIIKNEIEYIKIKNYITNNPIMWEKDKNYVHVDK